MNIDSLKATTTRKKKKSLFESNNTRTTWDWKMVGVWRNSILTIRACSVIVELYGMKSYEYGNLKVDISELIRMGMKWEFFSNYYLVVS